MRLENIDLINCRMMMEQNGELVSQGKGGDCLGSPINAMLWLARTMNQLGKPMQAGDVILSGALGPMVSAAAGAVGQVVGQIAKLKGCRVVGVAGAADKCAYVVEELGFDAAVNYRASDFAEQLAKACAEGVDVYFENVGGAVFDAVLPLMNDFGRIPVCGRIAHYNNAAASGGVEGGASPLVRTMGLVLVRRLTLRGFIVSDHTDRLDDFLRDMGGWLRSGQLRYREDLVQGLDSAIDAFQGLLEGRNRGKLLVQVGADPTLPPT